MASDEGTHVRQRDIVVIGASAGGVEALGSLARQLDPEFPAAILVVLHIAASGKSVLPDILQRGGQMPAAAAVNGEAIQRGQIYVAPNDLHMLVHDGTLALSHGPRENGHRPAIDPLFRSAARAYGDRVVGVVLSGMLDDGASGLRFIKQRGGVAVVQDPDDAMYAAMPRAALDATDVDRVVPIDRLGGVLADIVDHELPAGPPPPVRDRDDPGGNGRHDYVELDPTFTDFVDGPASGLTCPECGGALWESTEGTVVRYRCQVGHSYSPTSLIEAQGQSLEGSLWAALRALEERGDLLRRLGRRAGGRTRESFNKRAAEADSHATKLRDVLMTAGRLAPVED